MAGVFAASQTLAGVSQSAALENPRPTVRSVGSMVIEASNTAVVLTVPTDLAAGDLLVAVVMRRSLPASDPPAGWSLLTSVGPVANGVASQYIHVYSKVATGVEGGTTVTFSQASAGRTAGEVLVIAGPNGTPKFESSLSTTINNTSTISVAIPTQTMAFNRRLILAVFSQLLANISPATTTYSISGTAVWTARSPAALQENRIGIFSGHFGVGVDPSGTGSIDASTVSSNGLIAHTLTFSPIGSVRAVQTLDDVTQVATALGPARLSAAQTLADVAQTANGSCLVKASAAQNVAAVSQVATGTVSGGTVSISAAQTLAGVSQSAGVAHVAAAAAAQVLMSAVQAATAQALARVSGSQALDDAAQVATAKAVASLAAAQLLDDVLQVATGTAALVRTFEAAQVLAGVLQVARMGHAFTFERNERTLLVAAERRGYVVLGEVRTAAAVRELRTVALAGERRRIAFTD